MIPGHSHFHKSRASLIRILNNVARVNNLLADCNKTLADLRL
jgi:hypothetical protein